ncbi:hypothetical protein HanPSC8_Chr04g0166841 [Helianthus annuus]|nr:hypothetical protein HanPSC8_Chr04g0166841 [Helianthus annuus]
MTPPKGITKWKRKFFYVKAAAVAAKMTFRNVNETIPAEDLALPNADTVSWFPSLKPIKLKKLDNSQLWVLRMMLSKPDRKSRPVVREKSEDAALWRMANTSPHRCVRCSEPVSLFGLRKPLPRTKQTALLQVSSSFKSLVSGSQPQRVHKQLLLMEKDKYDARPHISNPDS